MNHFKKTALLISLSLILTACGGGGGGSSSGSSIPTAPSDTTPTIPDNDSKPDPKPGTPDPDPKEESTGFVLEKLDTSKEYRAIFDFGSVNGSSKITNVQQNDDGILTQIGSFNLYGNLVGNEIEGNKNFALARLSKGTADYTNYKNEIETNDIGKYVNSSYYYFAYRPLTAKASAVAQKQINCTDLKTTQARLTSGGQHAYFITPTIHNGSINLNPNGDIGVAFTVKTGSDETSYASTMNWIEGSNVYNGYNTLGIANQTGSSNQTGAFAVGENGANSFVVGSIYKITLNSGAIYQGLMSMTCNL